MYVDKFFPFLLTKETNMVIINPRDLGIGLVISVKSPVRTPRTVTDENPLTDGVSVVPDLPPFWKEVTGTITRCSCVNWVRFRHYERKLPKL